jgi:tripartite-type tricarboxylate transporter receptor subunit TctC
VRALLLAFLVAALPAAAQVDYPKGIVRFVVPFPPGGPTDTLGRIVTVRLQEAWGRPVLIEYKPGGNTSVGIDAVAKSAPDGHTVGLVNSAFPILPLLRKNMPYDTLKDLAGVSQLVDIEIALVASSAAPFATLGELVAHAKRNPGKLSFATPGAGGTAHLVGELLKRAAGIDIVHVPYKGSAPAQTDVIGGRVELMVDPFFSALPFVRAGKMKMIASAGERRIAGFEQYPTIAETYPGFEAKALLGLVVPAATPRAVIERLQADVAKVVNAPAERRRIEELGMQVVASRPAQFDAFIRAEQAKWGRVIQEAKIELE